MGFCFFICFLVGSKVKQADKKPGFAVFIRFGTLMPVFRADKKPNLAIFICSKAPAPVFRAVKPYSGVLYLPYPPSGSTKFQRPMDYQNINGA